MPFIYSNGEYLYDQAAKEVGNLPVQDVAGAPQTYTVTMSGGVTTSGAATTLKCHLYTATTSGGVVTGGAATTALTHQFAASMSGGVVTGGAATLARSYARSAAGGVTTGGAATTKLFPVIFGSGGVVTSGHAGASLNPAYVPSGGVVTGGHAAAILVPPFAASGGVVVGGQATASLNPAYIASGGVVTGGQAAAGFNRTYFYVMSGGVDFSKVLNIVWVGTGGATASGAGSVCRAFAESPSGGVTTSAVAGLIVVRDVVGAGGLLTARTRGYIRIIDMMAALSNYMNTVTTIQESKAADSVLYGAISEVRFGPPFSPAEQSARVAAEGQLMFDRLVPRILPFDSGTRLQAILDRLVLYAGEVETQVEMKVGTKVLIRMLSRMKFGDLRLGYITTTMGRVAYDAGFALLNNIERSWEISPTQVGFHSGSSSATFLVTPLGARLVTPAGDHLVLPA